MPYEEEEEKEEEEEEKAQLPLISFEGKVRVISLLGENERRKKKHFFADLFAERTKPLF